jgi:hypothetical protein
MQKRSEYLKYADSLLRLENTLTGERSGPCTHNHNSEPIKNQLLLACCLEPSSIMYILAGNPAIQTILCVSTNCQTKKYALWNITHRMAKHVLCTIRGNLRHVNADQIELLSRVCRGSGKARRLCLAETDLRPWKCRPTARALRAPP